MLDRKTKNIDANEELLQDKKKICTIVFTIVYFIGWFMVLAAAVFAPYKWDEVFIGIGISLLIIGGYFLVIELQINTLIYLKRQFEKRKKND